MNWIIQENFYSQRNHSLLISALNLLEISYIEISLKELSFVNEKIKNNIIACGGNVLMAAAKSYNWNPGSFLTEAFDFRKWSEAYHQNLLNNDFVVKYLSDFSPTDDKFFIRPVEDNKAFNGGVISKKEFISLKNKVLDNREDVEIVASSCKEIYTETRFFIVNNEIISASQYKSGGKLLLNSIIDSSAINFVKEMINQWEPSKAYVLDVALTSDGYKVIELNNITSSGFYDCDVTKIVFALDNFVY